MKQALAEARTIGALTFALRITTDLAEYWAATHRKIDAIQLLSSVLTEFTEGYGTLDLIRAFDC